MEKWKDIEQTGGQYQVSSTGRIKRLWRITKSGRFYQEKIIAQAPIYSGYLHAQIYINKKCTTLLVHRIVAKAFIPNPDNLPEINHIDCNKQNNNVENLEWCDRTHNMREASKNGLMTGGQISKRKRPHYILQTTIDDIPIRSFWTAHDAEADTGVSFSSIRHLIREKSHDKQRGGYKWRECSQEEYEKYKDGPICKAIEYNNGKRRISALSDSGEIVQTYESVSDAAKAINSKPQFIRMQMKKGQHCKGYYWKYTDQV